ncbi:hypothetical protein CHELA17_60610 [Chelatococcus asaccharovorans]|nr:hypothetical protein CHELA17_60610 [Chelatococcus asaccharovorans]
MRPCRLPVTRAARGIPSGLDFRTRMQHLQGTLEPAPSGLAPIARAEQPGATDLPRGFRYGQGHDHQDPSRVDGRYRPFLRDEEERSHDDGQADDQEVRSGCPQARRVQGIEDQVIDSP